MNKTNFDKYLEEQLKDKDFADRFERAGSAWDVALQIAALRKDAGVSQKELARVLGTSQQQISRLESPAYEGHSLSMLRRVAKALHAEIKVVFEPVHPRRPHAVAEAHAHYGSRNPSSPQTRRPIAGVDSSPER
jgi:transcriptional regulator with XRE-family HTH domain